MDDNGRISLRCKRQELLPYPFIMVRRLDGSFRGWLPFRGRLLLHSLLNLGQ